MTSDALQHVLRKSAYEAPAWMKTVGLALTVIGGLAWIAGLFVDYDAAWRSYLFNYFFWTGLALGGVLWSATLRITNARWGRSLLRLWEGMGFFLPVSLLLFAGLLVGALTSHVYPWVGHPIELKEQWLAPGFVLGRTTVYTLLLFGLVMLYLYHSLKSDVRVLHGTRLAPAWFERMFANADGSDAEWQKSQNRLVRLAPILALAYGILVSLLAFDLLMSLEPYWYSTMFGGFIFMGNMYLGLAAITWIAPGVAKRALLQDQIGKMQYWDLGKLFFAFTMLWTYLMWSQYLPIWYSNYHEEAGYVLKRTAGPYRDWAFLLLALVWVIPWWMLLPKNLKMRPGWLGAATLIGAVGIWLERWTIVIPSQFDTAPVAAEAAVFPGWIDLGAGALYAGLFLLSYRFFLNAVPVVAVGDTIMRKLVTGELKSHGH